MRPRGDPELLRRCGSARGPLCRLSAACGCLRPCSWPGTRDHRRLPELPGATLPEKRGPTWPRGSEQWHRALARPNIARFQIFAVDETRSGTSQERDRPSDFPGTASASANIATPPARPARTPAAAGHRRVSPRAQGRQQAHAKGVLRLDPRAGEDFPTAAAPRERGWVLHGAWRGGMSFARPPHRLNTLWRKPRGLGLGLGEGEGFGVAAARRAGECAAAPGVPG